MKLLAISVLLIALWAVTKANVCNVTCTYTQVCGNDGICYERSELVKCSSWRSTFVHYCRKGQECCGSKCIPYGANCCGGSKYCGSAYTCCASDLCCPPDKVCDNGACVVQKSVKLTWWHILIIIALAVAFPVVVFLWKRRRARIRANNECGTVVMVHGNPVHTPLQSTTVLGQTNAPSRNVAFIISK